MMPDDCHSSRPVSVIELHGTADPEVLQGGSHVWFAPGLGAADGALDATTVIWQFIRPLPIR